ncbi:unnamed protein product [Blepharisma stoltei]|uniref:Uncharacterized protein n=1 Tax=Blepharisma stoltei TaxID=1481888 RepID=A0AAU9IHJ9_9CILI|nr:unnamed protein product [Blepharisma stoltei]
MNCWKANVEKYQQKIKEMDEEESKIREKVIGIKTKDFKKDQQMRLLHMASDELISIKNSPDKPDGEVFHPDDNFCTNHQ